MARELPGDVTGYELAAAALVALILGGLLVRNVAEADSSEEAVRVVVLVAALGALFGYRFVGRHLPARRDGALLLLVGGFVAAAFAAVAPEAFDAELVAALAAAALLGVALVVGSAVDLSTRAFGAAVAVAGVAIVAAELTVFGGDVAVGVLLALLGVLTVLDPDGFEAVERADE